MHIEHSATVIEDCDSNSFVAIASARCLLASLSAIGNIIFPTTVRIFDEVNVRTATEGKAIVLIGKYKSQSILLSEWK